MNVNEIDSIETGYNLLAYGVKNKIPHWFYKHTTKIFDRWLMKEHENLSEDCFKILIQLRKQIITSMFTIIAILYSLLSCPYSNAEILGGLNNDTFKIKLYGGPINLAPAVNVKISFSNPNVVSLSSEPPGFYAFGVNKLLTSSDPDNNIISAVWDDVISNDEATIIFMLVPGSVKGFSSVKLEKVETAGGLDITDRIVSVLDKTSVINTAGLVIAEAGEFELLDPGKLISPGKAAIAFRIDNIKEKSISAKLNGKDVEFVNDKVGIATVDLPTNENTLNLNLSISKQNQSTTINLGSIKIDSGTSNIYPPYIRKAIAVNYPSYTDFQIDGKQFGVRRFGKENTSIQVVPTSTVITNNNLRRRLSRQQLVPTNCIPYGSYVNIAHPAGTTTKKITVIHSCNR